MQGDLILVTGSTGGLGEKVVAQLAQNNARLRCFVRNGENRFIHSNIEIATGSLEDFASLQRACVNVDIILHMAGATYTNSTSQYHEVNHLGTQRLISAAESAPNTTIKKFLYLSTCAIGEGAGPYGHSKKLAEETLKKSNMPYVIIRPSEVYGLKKRSMLEKLAYFATKYPVVPLIGRGNIKMAPVHADDVVDGIITAVERGKPGATYILSGPEVVTYRTLIQSMLGIKKRRFFVPLPVGLFRLTAGVLALTSKNPPLYRDQIPRFLTHKNYDSSKAQYDLGYKPRPYRPEVSTV